MIEAPDCKCVVREFAVIVPYLNLGILLQLFNDMRRCIVVLAHDATFIRWSILLDHDDEISIHNDYDNMEMTDLSVS